MDGKGKGDKQFIDGPNKPAGFHVSTQLMATLEISPTKSQHLKCRKNGNSGGVGDLEDNNKSKLFKSPLY